MSSDIDDILGVKNTPRHDTDVHQSSDDLVNEITQSANNSEEPSIITKALDQFFSSTGWLIDQFFTLLTKIPLAVYMISVALIIVGIAIYKAIPPVVNWYDGHVLENNIEEQRENSVSTIEKVNKTLLPDATEEQKQKLGKLKADTIFIDYKLKQAQKHIDNNEYDDAKRFIGQTKNHRKGLEFQLKNLMTEYNKNNERRQRIIQLAEKIRNL
jgi:hypothetical protein